MEADGVAPPAAPHLTDCSMEPFLYPLGIVMGVFGFIVITLAIFFKRKLDAILEKKAQVVRELDAHRADPDDGSAAPTPNATEWWQYAVACVKFDLRRSSGSQWVLRAQRAERDNRRRDGTGSRCGATNRQDFASQQQENITSWFCVFWPRARGPHSKFVRVSLIEFPSLLETWSH